MTVGLGAEAEAVPLITRLAQLAEEIAENALILGVRVPTYEVYNQAFEEEGPTEYDWLAQLIRDSGLLRGSELDREKQLLWVLNEAQRRRQLKRLQTPPANASR